MYLYCNDSVSPCVCVCVCDVTAINASVKKQPMAGGSGKNGLQCGFPNGCEKIFRRRLTGAKACKYYVHSEKDFFPLSHTHTLVGSPCTGGWMGLRVNQDKYTSYNNNTATTTPLYNMCARGRWKKKAVAAAPRTATAAGQLHADNTSSPPPTRPIE